MSVLENESDVASAIVDKVEWNGRVAIERSDRVVAEAPLEIRVMGVSLAVVMRTPGHDFELVRGFLLSEGMITDPAHVLRIRHCDRVSEPETEDSVVEVLLHDDASFSPRAWQRNLYASSSCGVCGKASIERAMAVAPPVASTSQVAVSRLHHLPERMRAGQSTFDATGGLHAAALFDLEGERWVVREDVGRHNAVDKVIGWCAERERSPERAILTVSGRVSFEIVQKALAARIPIVVAVSAPSSLAVALASRAGITLVGFARDQRLCAYANAHRIFAT